MYFKLEVFCFLLLLVLLEADEGGAGFFFAAEAGAGGAVVAWFSSAFFLLLFLSSSAPAFGLAFPKKDSSVFCFLAVLTIAVLLLEDLLLPPVVVCFCFFTGCNGVAEGARFLVLSDGFSMTMMM